MTSPIAWRHCITRSNLLSEVALVLVECGSPLIRLSRTPVKGYAPLLMQPEPPNAPDLSLLLAALWHVALGLTMGALQIASGMGLLRLATWGRLPASFRDEFLYGFPLGL